MVCIVIGPGNNHYTMYNIGDIGWVPLGTVEMSVQEYLEWAQKQSDFGDYATSARSDMRALGTVRGGT